MTDSCSCYINSTLTIAEAEISETQPIGILFVSKDSSDPYGSTNSFLSVAEHFRSMGCEMAMFTFPKGYLDRTAEGWGIPHDGYAFDWIKRRTAFGRLAALMRQKLSVLWTITRMLRAGRHDVMYINTTTHVSPLLAAWFLRRKTVVHVREGEDYFATAGSRKRWVINGIRNAILRRCAHRFFCVSQHVADTVNRSLGIDRAQAIYNGIDLSLLAPKHGDRDVARQRLGFSESDFVVICAGRMHEEKAIGKFVEAAIIASDDVPNLRAIGIGGPHDTPYFLNVVKPLADLDPEGVVQLPGYCTNMRDYYAASDLFIHPATYDEPLARTILEAMGMGCCIVATDVGGTPEMITNESNGFLVKPGDVDAMARMIVALSYDPKLRGRTGQAARVTAEERFTASRYVNEVEMAINELLGS